jgi:diguanylate cyclase (GGDEF)-like protein/PAS domain S-box-containing protein
MFDDSRAGRPGFTDRLARRFRRRREGDAPVPNPQEVMRDPYRVAALRRVGLLDTPYDEVIDRLTRIAARVSDAPVALFTLLDEERQVCKSCVGLSEAWVAGAESPLAYSYCQRAVALGSPLVIDDSRVDPLVRSDPATLRGVVAYVGIPLITDGHAIGTLCVIDFQPRQWTEEAVETLEELAAALIAKIELRVAAREADEKARAALRAQEALRESEARFRTAFDAAPIGMALTAIDGRWIRVNDALCEIVGYSREELLTHTYQEITHPDELEEDRVFTEGLLAGELPSGAREKRYIHKDGRAIWIQLNVSLVRDARGEPFHFIIQAQDITERRSEQERLRELSFRDELTDLYNRRAFLAMARERLKLARRQGRGLVLLFADIDEMKWINDSFGHLEGDRAIAATARLLRESFRESDLVARLGGDEFAVLAGGTPDGDAEPLLHRFQTQLESANAETGRPYELKVSLGATLVHPDDDCPIDELVERADLRMYEAKGRRGVMSYELNS